MIAHRLKAGTALPLAAIALLTPGLASAQEKRLDVTPYIGVDQTVMAPLKGGGDVLTFTNVNAGLTAQVQNRRVEASIDLQYNHNFSWDDRVADQDQLSGIANASFHVARGLSINTGGIASRIRTDGLSGAQAFADDGYTSQMYAGYIGPSYATKVGDFDIGASYQLGYARVNDSVSANSVNGQPLGGSFADSWTHSLTGSVGFAPDTVLPAIGLVASAGYDREDASQLDQRYEDKWGRVDATLPVSTTLALVGGVGYEDMQIHQRSPVLDEDGVPVISDGRYVTDSSTPRALVYDQDGLIWDAGVLWRPSRRMSATARVGQRYGGTTYSGSLVWEGRASSFGLFVFDGVDSFGRVITTDLAALSGSDLQVGRNPFTNDLTGCAFSTTGGGRCFNDALSGITGANYRYRGVSGQWSTRYGPWSYGVGAGYSLRKFITASGERVLIRGTKDQNWYGNASVVYTISDSDSIDAVLYGNYFDASGTRPDVLNYGATTSYYKNITRRLSAQASLGIDGVKSDDTDTQISAMGQVGMRYSF
jgi:hypothetical protein